MATLGYIAFGGVKKDDKKFFTNQPTRETLQRKRMALATDRKSNRCPKCFLAMPLTGECDNH